MRLVPFCIGLAAVLVLAACAAEPELHEVEERFPRMPLTSAVAVGPDGDVYVAEWKPDAPLRRFDASGTALPDWGMEATAGPARCTYALTVDAAGYVYALTVGEGDETEPPGSDAAIRVFDPEGTPTGAIELGEGALDLAADEAGRLYVVLGVRIGIRVFERDGQHIADWLAGEMPFEYPVGVAVRDDGRLVVADVRLQGAAPPKVLTMTPDGDLLDEWTIEDLPAGQFVRDVAVDRQGRVWVLADGDVVRVYSAEGDLLAEFEPGPVDGEPTEVPDCPALFVPARMAVGPDAALYWTPSWDRAMHPPSPLRAFEVDWAEE